MRPAILAAAFLALAGCFGMCGLTPERATWEDPGLYAAMPAPGFAAGATSTWTAPEPGLPFGRVIDASWGPHNLTTVGHHPGGDVGAGSVDVDLTPAGLQASTDNATTAARVAEAVRAFLGNATTLDAAAQDAVVDALLANQSVEPGFVYGGDGWDLVPVRYHAGVPDGLRLRGLYEDLERLGALQVGLGGAGAGPWAFGFSLASRTLQDGDGTLTVGPTGVALFEGLREGERSEDAYREDVVAWLRGHGLPEPPAMDVQGSVC